MNQIQQGQLAQRELCTSERSGGCWLIRATGDSSLSLLKVLKKIQPRTSIRTILQLQESPILRGKSDCFRIYRRKCISIFAIKYSNSVRSPQTVGSQHVCTQGRGGDELPRRTSGTAWTELSRMRPPALPSRLTAVPRAPPPVPTRSHRTAMQQPTQSRAQPSPAPSALLSQKETDGKYKLKAFPSAKKKDFSSNQVPQKHIIGVKTINLYYNCKTTATVSNKLHEQTKSQKFIALYTQTWLRGEVELYLQTTEHHSLDAGGTTAAWKRHHAIWYSSAETPQWVTNTTEHKCYLQHFNLTFSFLTKPRRNSQLSLLFLERILLSTDLNSSNWLQHWCTFPYQSVF